MSQPLQSTSGSAGAEHFADAEAEAEAAGVAAATSTPLAIVPPAGALLAGAAPSLPPHPARSITAHAITAPAAFPLPLLEPHPLNRLLRALIRHRASLGLCPITVHVFVTIGHGGSAHYRVNTVIFRRFCPVCGDLSDYTTLGRHLRVDQSRARALMHGVT